MPNFKKGIDRERKNRRNREYLSKSIFFPSFGYNHQLFRLLVLEDMVGGGVTVLSDWLFGGCWFVWLFFCPLLTTKATSCFKARYWKVFGISFSQMDLLRLENQHAGVR